MGQAAAAAGCGLGQDCSSCGRSSNRSLSREHALFVDPELLGPRRAGFPACQPLQQMPSSQCVPVQGVKAIVNGTSAVPGLVRAPLRQDKHDPLIRRLLAEAEQQWAEHQQAAEEQRMRNPSS
mmetsp:Transcript_102212/g.197880  ORF Transcript_102212/g.197880 Transcript_102212/m.197880 type:complete len:123 (-) Transcript_102212:175-543(-)